MNKYDFSKEIINNLIGNIKSNDSNDYIDKLHIKHEDNKNILIIITDNNNLDNILMRLIKLRNEGFEFHLVISNKVKELADIEMIKLRLRPKNIYLNYKDLSNKNITKEIDIAIAPTITQNDIVKLSLGIQDDISSSIMWNILWENKSLFIDTTNVVKSIDSGENDYLKNMINDYILKLEKMGVKIISSNYNNEFINKTDIHDENIKSDDKNTIIDNKSKKVITEKDILKIKGDCKNLTLPINTIITPLAYDTARKRGLEIIKK